MKYKKPELTRVEVKIKPNTNASDRSSCEGGIVLKLLTVKILGIRQMRRQRLTFCC